ncbi:MAG: sigma-54 dependent transcriptional regulator [Acidobacteriota bacterium]|nr:sigma-54 dependent transcriptional regulator [Acidobacteriota bacterium]
MKLARLNYAEGQFTAALKAARSASPRTKNEREEQECLICQCVQYAGEFESALRTAESALTRELTAEHTARYWEVIGRSLLDQMNPQDAAAAFRKGVRAAEKCPDLRVLASVQQMWLVTVGETLGTGLSPAVREAYHTAVRSADPASLAGFHVRLARLEGQQGAFGQSLHHLSLAKSLLDRCSHAGLSALYSINRACVLALTGSYDTARRSAEIGVSEAEQAGHVRLAMAGAATVAHIAISAGELSVAESWLRVARKAAARIGVMEVALLDSLASLALVQGDFESAGRYLAETRSAMEARGLRWVTATETLGLFTELYFHKKRGDRAEFQRVLGTIRAAGETRSDRHSELLVRLAEAESLFDEGNYSAGRERIAECLRRSPIHTVYLPELNRMMARSLWVDGHRSSAKRRLLRSFSTAAVKGTRLTWADALSEAKAVERPEPCDLAYSIEEQSKQAKARFSALVPHSSDTWFQQTVPATTIERDSLDGFDDAVGILESGSDPELRGREALASAIALGIAEGAALYSRTDAGIRMISAIGISKQSLEATMRESSSALRMVVGRVDTKTIELVLKPKRDLRSLSAAWGIKRLLEASKAIDAQQKDQQRLGSLWQPENIIEEPGAVFSSAPMIELMQTARKVAITTLPVLLLGNTGTGKEVLARAIHRASARANKIFLPFNCSAVPRDMIESQLFGYRRGSFTGAGDDFPGIIRSAEGGTLFLDEIGELSMDLQPKLLRFLEANEIHPLGEGAPLKVDVRIIAATNANLDDLIQLKEFREDLYYRLNIVRFLMPQLHERREEIPPLVTHLLRRYEVDEKKNGFTVSDELMEYLLLYKWPGNIRQLSNELRRMVAMVPSGEVLTPDHLAPAIRATRRTVPAEPATETPAAPAPEPATPDPGNLTVRLDQPLSDAFEAVERAMIDNAMTRSQGKLEEASRLLGISRKGLFLKRRRWQGPTEPPAAQA